MNLQINKQPGSRKAAHEENQVGMDHAHKVNTHNTWNNLSIKLQAVSRAWDVPKPEAC